MAVKGQLKDITIEEMMVTFDNAYQMQGVHVLNVNIVICEM